MPTTHRDSLWRRASARWAEIRAISADLLPAVALQQKLVQLMLDGAEQLDQRPPASLPPARVIEKWRQGLPALRNEQVPIPDSLKQLLPAFCMAIADAGAGESVLHVRDALLHGDIDAGSLLGVSLARNRKAIRTSALHMGFSPDLIWLVGELGSSPLAHHLQVQVMAGLNAGTTTADQGGLADWDRGYCPFCGSWPVFIESVDASRHLRCSFCALAWAMRAYGCIYCGNSGEDFVAAASDVKRGERRVELCGKCGSYTKVIEVSAATPFPLLAIEDLASIDLDRGAMDRQYVRPELYDLDTIDPLKSC